MIWQPISMTWESLRLQCCPARQLLSAIQWLCLCFQEHRFRSNKTLLKVVCGENRNTKSQLSIFDQLNHGIGHPAVTAVPIMCIFFDKKRFNNAKNCSPGGDRQGGQRPTMSRSEATATHIQWAAHFLLQAKNNCKKKNSWLANLFAKVRICFLPGCKRCLE